MLGTATNPSTHAIFNGVDGGISIALGPGTRHLRCSGLGRFVSNVLAGLAQLTNTSDSATFSLPKGFIVLESRGKRAFANGLCDILILLKVGLFELRTLESFLWNSLN